MGAIATPGVVKGLFAGASRPRPHADARHRRAGDRRSRGSGVPVDADAGLHAAGGARHRRCGSVDAGAVRQPGAARRRVGEGERLRLPDLADALEILAIEGEDLFYRGEMAAAADARLRRRAAATLAATTCETTRSSGGRR